MTHPKPFGERSRAEKGAQDRDLEQTLVFGAGFLIVICLGLYEIAKAAGWV